MNEQDRQEVEELITQKLDLVSAFRDLPDDAREQIAEDIERFLYFRQPHLRRPENFYTPRITVADQDINLNESGVLKGHAGPTLPRWINFTSGSGTLDDEDLSKVNISIGGGADCMFDYLVSECFATLPGFTEGQTFTSLSGCTFIGYSNVTDLFTALNAITTNGAYVAYICGGTYEVNACPIDFDSGTRVHIYGAGQHATRIQHEDAPPSAGEAVFDLVDTGERLFWHNLSIGGTSVAYANVYAFLHSASLNHSMTFENVDIDGKLSMDAAGMAFHQCQFTHGLIVDGGTLSTVEFRDCEWGTDGGVSVNISVDIDQVLFDGCRGDGSWEFTGGTPGFVMSDCTLGTSGASRNWIHIDGVSGIIATITGCRIGTAPDSNGSIYIENTASRTELVIVGNKFAYATGSGRPHIHSADSAAQGIITGNVFERDGTADWTEDDAGYSVTGLWGNTVFGPNYPATVARYNITGSDNEFYPSTSAAGSSTGGDAPSTADYLVGTAQAGLSAEIVVGTTPGGELGGTWASPTVDATHSGSTHSTATDAHIADTTDAHDASAISIVDAGGYFTGTDVEAALQELGAGSGGAPRAAILYDAIVDSADPDVGANNIYNTILEAVLDNHETIFFRENSGEVDFTISGSDDVVRIVGDSSTAAEVGVNVLCTKSAVLFDSLSFTDVTLWLQGAQDRAFACFFTGTLPNPTADINNGAGITATASSIAYDNGQDNGSILGSFPVEGYGRIGNEYITWTSGGGISSGTLTGALRGYHWTLRQTHADNDEIVAINTGHLIIDNESIDVTACFFVGCDNPDANAVYMTNASSNSVVQVCRFLSNTTFNNIAIALGDTPSTNTPRGVKITSCNFVGSVKDFHISVWPPMNAFSGGGLSGLQVKDCSFDGMHLGAIKTFGSANISGNNFASGLTASMTLTYSINEPVDGINSSENTIPYDGAAGTGTAPDKGVLLIDNEMIAYSSKDATNFYGCIRGFADSVAASHADNATITVIGQIATATNSGNALMGTKGILISGNSYDNAATLLFAMDDGPTELAQTPPRVEFTGNVLVGWKRAHITNSWVWSNNLSASQGSGAYVDCRSQTGIKFAGGNAVGSGFEIRNKNADTNIDLQHLVSGTGVLSQWMVPDQVYPSFGGASGARSGPTVPLLNKSGAASVTGHVAVQDTGFDNAWETTATGGLATVLGVVVTASIADASDALIQTHGVAEVLCNGTVNRGDHLETSTTTGEARAAGGGYVAGTTFARALTARSGGGSSMVKALVYGCGG